MILNNMISPPPLQKGDTIGLVAPSSPLGPGRLETGIPYLERCGYQVKLGSHLKDGIRFLAGRDEDRARDIMAFFKDPTIKAIVATAGGSGSTRLLSLLDYDVITAHPKILTGFSDTTGLSLGIYAKTGLVTYSGFTFRDTETGQPDPLIHDTFMACLEQRPYQINEGITIHPGQVQGPLIGGTLSLIRSLIGTPYQPHFQDAILFFEEVWAEPFQVDEMLSQLKLAGIFEQVAGIIIGQFEHCIAHHNPERDGTIHDVIDEWAARFKVPCLKEFPYGHGNRRCVLPIGKVVSLDATRRIVQI
ncbi:MAG: LD-carboxypeptidase [Gammaproteobacteria bacterium]